MLNHFCLKGQQDKECALDMHSQKQSYYARSRQVQRENDVNPELTKSAH
jgi:hypothetical protein